MGIFDKRVNYKPFDYGGITTPFIEAMWASHWTHKEFNFSKDVQDFKTGVTDEEREIIRKTVLLISQVEVAVKSYWSNIGKLLPKPEIADMGAVFGGVEVIHSRAYSHILEKLGLNDDFQGILAEGVVDRRVKYLTKYINKVYKTEPENIAYSLCLFTLFTENVSLFSQFFIILGFNRFRGLFTDVSNVVQYTSKEESVHAEGGIALINQIRIENPEIFTPEFTQRLIDESKEALEAEFNLITWIVGDYENEFLSKEILREYLIRRMNTSLEKIGVGTVFPENKELTPKVEWMEEEVYVSAITDFFIKKPIDYQKNNKSFTEEDLF